MVAYCTGLSKFQTAYTTNGGDLPLERQRSIRADTYVAKRVGKFDARAFQVYGQWNTFRVENRLCSNQNHFRFSVV